jgi:hypothetical protein
VHAIVIYESLTGNTRKAGELIGEELARRGVEVAVCSTTNINFQALARADLVIVGSWTDGLILMGQRPGRSGRLRTLPVIDGKRAIVYITYAVDPGKALRKLEGIVAERGGEVLGGLAIHRGKLEEGARELVEGALSAVS